MYHIVKTKSLTRPYRVVNVDAGNREVIHISQPLSSKAACFTNIVATMDTVACNCDCIFYVLVQDDTLRTPSAFTLYDNRKRVYNIDAVPKYIPGRNKKRKA